LPRRFTIQGRQVYDHWQHEKLSLVTVSTTAENLAAVHKIFAFQSNLMQNIVHFTPGNFQISILTEPFVPCPADTLHRLTRKEAKSALRQSIALCNAAREWDMDFLDFSTFQILPGGTLRFPWKLRAPNHPSPFACFPSLAKNRHLRGLNEGNYRDFIKNQAKIQEAAEFPGYLCRREDLASTRLQYRYPGTGKPSANAKIRIRTKFAWQKKVACNTLFHNLINEETLLLRIDLGSTALDECLSALCGRRNPGKNSLAARGREFSLFLKRSVYQDVILVIDNLAKKEDDRFLRFLLESGDISGLTVFLFDDSVAGDCDLEFNEDPQNLVAKHNPTPFRAPVLPELSASERELLQRLSLIEVPVPMAVARVLAAQGDGRSRPAIQGDGLKRPAGRNGDARLAALLKKGALLEDKGRLTVVRDLSGYPAPAPSLRRDELLDWLADHSDWAYARVAHHIASGQWAALEQYLQHLAQESPGQVAPGPAAELIHRCLPQAPAGSHVLEYFVDVLIRGNCLGLAAKALAATGDPDSPPVRLKTAHLAMRRRDYRKLARLLDGISPIPERLRDEWLYLNFIAHEKTSQTQKADTDFRKIKSHYYKNLALIQWSDRRIYRHDFTKARAQLAGALEFFSARGLSREAIEAQNQMAKLLREEGRRQEAESLYKTIYIQAEAEGLSLNSASAAVDLGNLYLEGNDDFLAECWYQKALKLYAKEKDQDGIMLVNSNRVNILLANGNWLEADRLLRAALAWDEEKQLLHSCAIDYLNLATLETLRLRDDHARKLIDHAARTFQNLSNHKGLSECAFLRSRLTGFAEESPATMPAGEWFSEDQKLLCRMFTLPAPTADPGREAAFFKLLAAIRSRKVKFEALRLLLKKYRKSEWLAPFKEIAWELSAQEKNYFYYEYWYMYFDLASEEFPGVLRNEFLAMHDFFTTNKRFFSSKLNRMHQHLEEGERARELFDDVRLVEHSRQWRLPEDFFNSFSHEIGKAAPIDWLVMAIHENKKPLFTFASSSMFGELGAEMLRDTLETAENQNLDLQTIQGKFRSQEKLFFPFASTKMIRWPISEHILACLVVGYLDRELLFQDFPERHRDTLKKFSTLFQNFLNNEYRTHEKLEFIVGESEKIKDLKRMIAQVSKVDFSLLITGESGSGKELVARAVHLLSPRADRPFISLNAAAIPETLLEAELFGYKKGAFSGAVESRVGLLEAADRGTLFLDEIADLPLPLQAKLLRALQEKEIRRLGENRTIQIDVRLISASNKDLEALIKKSAFREDLFYRLQDLVIHIPPLRERREDIPLLINHFLQKFGYPRQEQSKLHAITALFVTDDFPGNVRQLESKVKKMITFDPELDFQVSAGEKASDLKTARHEFERNLLLNALNEHSWQKGKAAAKLGISRMALFNLLKKHGISQ
jgi:DNA-binding NtrC family response regulator